MGIFWENTFTHTFGKLFDLCVNDSFWEPFYFLFESDGGDTYRTYGEREERVTRATPARTGRIAVISPTLIGEVLTAQLSSPIQTGNTGILLYVTTGPAVESNESF